MNQRTLTRAMAGAAVALLLSFGAYANTADAPDTWEEDAKAFIMENQEPDDYQQLELLYREGEDGLIENVQRRIWTCFARGRSGRTFSGRADSMSTARTIAFNRCTRTTRGCASRGCR